MKLYVMEWYESERGWGRRPDGYSLHISREAFDEHMQKHWKLMPATAPDEYEAPEWQHPQLVESPEDLAALVEKHGTLRLPHRWVALGKDGLAMLAPELAADAQAALVEKRVALEKACLEEIAPECAASRGAPRI